MPHKKNTARPRKHSLTDYARKRDFSRTLEPRPKQRGSVGLRFVVQKHSARRLHYDLRLELDGVLKSWAVTRGPSLIVGKKRLAIHTEDHPIEYLNFEGNIPKGEYGGGTMIVWDWGQWLPQGDPHRGLAKGHLAFSLAGTRLNGRWHLVRMRPRSGKKSENWLLIKSDDEYARRPGDREITDEEITSYLSGRTTEELAAVGELREDHKSRSKIQAKQKIKIPDISKIPGARKGLLPTFLEPCLASVCDKPPSGQKWIHEIKFDGYRMQARIDGRIVRLFTRKKLDWTERFRSVAAALKELGLGSALIDGEIVIEDDRGVSAFNALQADLKADRQDRFRYHVFDILYCNGFDLTRARLIDRKDLLQQIIARLASGSRIHFSEHLEEDGPTVFEHTCRLGLEGIVSKRKDLSFKSGRGEHWLKSKCVERQEFVILGYVPSTAAKGSVGSIPLGYWENGKLVYVGRVGTGWSADEARSLRNDLEKLRSTKPILARLLPAGTEKDVRWVEPKLVCEVEYRGWTQDRLLRQTSFKGIREDKGADEIVLENAPKPSKVRSTADIAGIRLTHSDRLLFEDGVTKQALAEFYAEIGDWILPHIIGRILSLLRNPSGVREKCFFAKHPWQGLSDSVNRVNIGKGQPMLAIDDLPGLISLVQSGVVEIHPWGSTVDCLEQPDRLVFDLDPGECVPWKVVIEAATDVKRRLEDLGLKSFVKTTGGKGLHVVVPVEPQVNWSEAKKFTGSLAAAMVKAHPDRYVATLAKQPRRGRVFVDFLRNSRGATAIAAYSTRARSHTSISTPLAWEELSEGIRSDHFTINNLRQRLDFLKRDPWNGFFNLRQGFGLTRR